MQLQLDQKKVPCVVSIPERGEADGLAQFFHFHVGALSIWFGRASVNLGLPEPVLSNTVLKMRVEGCNTDLTIWSITQITHHDSSGPTFVFDFVVLTGQHGMSDLILPEVAQSLVKRSMLKCVSRDAQGRSNLFEFSTEDAGFQGVFANVQMPSFFDLREIVVPLSFEDGRSGQFVLLPETERQHPNGDWIFECFCMCPRLGSAIRF